MTTKFKIIAGFAAMVILMAVVSFSGYTSLQTASDNFDEYRRLARFNVITSDIGTNMANAAASLFQFTSTDDDSLLAGAAKAYGTIETLAGQAGALIHIPERKEVLASLVQDTKRLQALMNDVKKDLDGILVQYDKAVDPVSAEMDGLLWELNESVLSSDNVTASLRISTSIRELGAVRVLFTGLSQSREPEDFPDPAKALETLKTSLDALSPLLTTGTEREKLAKLRELYAALQAAGRRMVEHCYAFQQHLADINRIGDAADVATAKLNTAVQADMDTQGPRTLTSNASGQKAVLGISAGGLILGAVLATLVIMGIVRVLRELGRFAGAIAAGNFNHSVNIREKGEVGEMVVAMRGIPDALNAVLAEYLALERRVEQGELTAKGDPEKFRGDFAILIKGTNSVLKRFVTILEDLPSPVVMLDRDLNAAYLNAPARKLAGEDYKGKDGSRLFAFDDYNTNASALKRALGSKSSADAETRAHPGGRDMDISYTAIPIYGKDGALLCVLQLLTDLTAIKQTQHTIMQVASQAADVSNRVAAASEELSAQVEQVTRGAEMQRARVESTASAMTEMNATVLEVARNAGQASEQIELTRDKAGSSSDLVGQVVRAIERVNSVAANLDANMRELGVQAESIGGVMNVISDIADQTNLLALNAAIEAARAGEAGRGFAVVADEVRKLAEKTMTATNEVGGSITAIQQSARINIDAMGDASKAVSEATALAGSSGRALSEIVGLASSNASLVTSIATAAEEQSATSEEINTAINEINRIVGDTSSGMAQAASAVQELSRMAQELNRIMDNLKEKR